MNEDILPVLLEKLLAEGLEVVAPVRRGELHRFEPVTEADSIVPGKPLADGSAKTWFFPPTEEILRYGQEGRRSTWESRVAEIPERVILGLRPCDAAALLRLDALFGWDGEDPWYQARRTRTLILTMACPGPDEHCFCTSVGLSPTSLDGSDLLLAAGRDGPVLTCVDPAAPRSARLLEILDGAAPLVPPEEILPVEGPPRRFADPASSPPPEDPYAPDLWEESGLRCLSCGACAFTCPTCHCFDLVDQGSARRGSRKRTWDSCCTELFTRHAGGHNPRGESWRRYRQRTLHKLLYYPDRFGAPLCTGCGRCNRICPAGVDIAEQAARVFGSAEEKE